VISAEVAHFSVEIYSVQISAEGGALFCRNLQAQIYLLQISAEIAEGVELSIKP
jgi:hypothetical protein